MSTLAPGQSTAPEDNLISRRFDMATPGTYTIQVERDVSNGSKGGVILSNKISIDTTEP